MTVVAVVGGLGAPGATTTALGLLLTWPLGPGRRAILLEADPDGGSVLAGALQGRVSAEYGLHQLGMAHRQGNVVDAFFRQLVDLSDGRRDRLLLPGLTDPAQASGLAYTWDTLAALISTLEGQEIPHDVLVDLGRNGYDGPSGVLAAKADAVVMVTRSTLRSVAAARPRAEALRRKLDAAGTGADALGLVVVEEGGYGVREVGQALGLPVFASLPHAPEPARALSDGDGAGGRRFERSVLLRSMRSCAEAVRLQVATRRARIAPPPAAGAEGVGHVRRS